MIENKLLEYEYMHSTASCRQDTNHGAIVVAQLFSLQRTLLSIHHDLNKGHNVSIRLGLCRQLD